jgi:hypothetical protein
MRCRRGMGKQIRGRDEREIGQDGMLNRTRLMLCV